jgi:hypothetical protein
MPEADEVPVKVSPARKALMLAWRDAWIEAAGG